MRLKEISKVFSLGIEGPKFSKRRQHDVLVLIFWSSTLEFKILKFLFSFAFIFPLAEILPDFQYVHKSLKILEKQIANVFRGYINYLITNQTSSQVHLIQLIQSHEYTCNLRIYQRNKRLKNVCFFINPGKSYVPIWKDETVLLKMHAELTYKQNEKQYFRHTLQFSLVRASDRSWKKSQISRDFQGQIRGKIGRFHGNFA